MPLIEKAMVGKRPDDLLWERPSGGFLRPLGHTSFFAHAVKRCVADGRIPERLTPHGLRHVAAGLQVASGASVKVVQKQLGHKSAMLTLDIYADLFDGDLDEVADKMDVGVVGVVVGHGVALPNLPDFWELAKFLPKAKDPTSTECENGV